MNQQYDLQFSEVTIDSATPARFGMCQGLVCCKSLKQLMKPSQQITNL